MPGTSAFPVLTARGTGHLAQGPARVQRGPAPESVDYARRHVVLYVLRRSTWLIVLITYVVGRRMNSPVLPSIRSLCINALHFRVPSIRISTSHASLSSQCSCIMFHPAPITGSLTLLPKRVFFTPILPAVDGPRVRRFRPRPSHTSGHRSSLLTSRYEDSPPSQGAPMSRQ